MGHEKRGSPELPVGSVSCFECRGGITSGCKICGKIIKSGTWAVGVELNGDLYCLPVAPPLMCCGEEKVAIDAFNTEAEAKVRMQELMDELEHCGQSLYALNLIPVPRTKRETRH